MFFFSLGFLLFDLFLVRSSVSQYCSSFFFKSPEEKFRFFVCVCFVMVSGPVLLLAIGVALSAVMIGVAAHEEVEDVDWDSVLGIKHHHLPKKDDSHSTEENGEELEDTERVGTPRKALAGHQCIHGEIKMENIPSGTVSYAVDPVGELSTTHAKRGMPNFHLLQEMLTYQHQKKGTGKLASEDENIPTPTAFPHLARESVELGADGQLRRRQVVQATSTFANMRIRYLFNVDGNGECTEVGETVTTYRGTTTTCTENDVLTAAKRSYIMDTLMSRGSTYLMNALNVVRVSGNLTVPGARCGASPGIVVPEVHRTVGLDNVDFLLYVTANPLGTTSNTVAFASTCFRDQNGRPIVGHINFVPAALGNAVTGKTSQADLDVNTAIHEACHALGFSSPFFSSYGYVNESGYRKTGGTTSDYDSTLGKTTTKMISPRVVAAAKAYFNCSTITGVEIEDQGGAGTQGVHWEKRILNQEFIAGVLSTSATYVSTFTLAYFEDTGFFTANYEYAQDGAMLWYKNKGCTVLKEKCNSVANKASGEFCFDTNAKNKYCTNDRTSGGYCAISSYSSVPASFRYFTDVTLGSSVLVDDFCPAVLPFSDKVCIEPTNVDAQDIYGNFYHSASRCFVSNLVQSDFDLGSEQDSRCFPYSCSIVTGSLLLNIRGQTARCPSDRSAGYADLSRVSGYKGVILCPEASMFCAEIGGPTPAPTPSPPTPVPTPAPPGFTPAPAPVVHTAKQWYNFDLPTACVNRTACAANLTNVFPACRLLAKRLSDCFGTNCNAELMAWTTAAGYNTKCSSIDGFAKECIEGYVGASALCTLATGGASLVGSSVFLLLGIMILQLWIAAADVEKM